MRKILIVNDDGIDSDGILRLAKTALKFGQVWVVAPARQMSAASHSINLREPIDVYPHDFPLEGVKAYAVHGTPADCVRVGVRNIVPGKPDLVLSGINFGYNTATDLQYSGTVGAALEAVFQGIPGIALSEGIHDSKEVTDAYLGEILAELIELDPGADCIWNVNFPDVGLPGCKGILRGRSVSRFSVFNDDYHEIRLEDGGIRYSVEGKLCHEAEEGSDLRAVLDGYISIGRVRNLSS